MRALMKEKAIRQARIVEPETILCIDPDSLLLNYSKSLFERNGYKCDTVQSIDQAIQVLSRKSPDVIITELNFPDLKGLEVLRSLRDADSDSVILILTSQPERRTGADRRLGLVFEYTVKPVSDTEILAHVKRAVSFSREKRSVMRYASESEDRMRNKLEWLIWKEKQLLGSKLSSEKMLLRNIRHSISQGKGFGGLLTQIDLLEMMSTRNGSKVEIQEKAIEELVASSNQLRAWFENMDRVVEAFDMEFDSTGIPGEDLRKVIGSAIVETDRFRAIKDHQVVCGDFSESLTLLITEDLLGRTLRELLTNAFKYSPEHSPVHIMKFRSGNSLSIVIINDVLEMQGGITGIPKELENMVFEPFYRLNNTYDERFHDEELGMGIGLTVLQNAINQCGGNIYLYEVVDHALSSTQRKRIVGEVILNLNDPGAGQIIV